jgi:predicted DNA-binding protein (MmcQ/YjbR family)
MWFCHCTHTSGKTPFCKNNRETVYAIYTRILHNSISFPLYFESQEKDLISRLCCPDKEKRLCDPDDIKAAPYFAGVNWDDIEARRAVPPFVPALYEVFAIDFNVTSTPDFSKKFLSIA